MTLCRHCGKAFPNLSGDECHKCRKYLQPELSDLEKRQLKSQPQCDGCSVVYPLMMNVMCGACKAAEVGAPQMTAQVLQRAFEHQGDASKERLQQPLSMNAGLQKAHQVRNNQTQQALQQQSKISTYLVEGYLLYYPVKAQNWRKAKIVPPTFSVPGTDEADAAMKGIKTRLQAAYDLVPGDGKVQLNWADGTFAIMQSKTKFASLEQYTQLTKLDMDSFFNEITNLRFLSDMDKKAKRFSLAFVTYESDQTVNSDEDLEDADQEPEFKVPEVPIPKKRKAPSGPLSAVPYTSAWRPSKRDEEINYVTYRFTKTTVKCDEGGNVEHQVHPENSDSIEIASQWHQEISDKPNGGYVAKGFMKYCFKGRYQEMNYAVFQAKQDRTTNSENHSDLIHELDLLAYGTYFMNSFRKRVAAAGKTMPDISWNFEGAFIGTIEKYIPGATDQLVPVSLIHDTFLAVRYLVRAEERKFSGANEAGENQGVVGRWMDAYSHHVHDDSDGFIVLTDLQGFIYEGDRVVLFDPQAHTENASSGFWDKGKDGIKAFKQQHKCRSLCRDLGLQPFPKEKRGGKAAGARQNPLRIGFSS